MGDYPPLFIIERRLTNVPDFVTNKLIFTGDEETINELLTKIAYDENQDSGSTKPIIGTIDFEKIIPIPENICQEYLNGEDNWYFWCNSNWNTKWNSISLDEEYHNDNTIMFDTAWKPPFPIIKKLSEMFPDIIITHYFQKEGYGFYGCFEYLKGCDKKIEKCIDDVYYELYGVNYEEGEM